MLEVSLVRVLIDRWCQLSLHGAPRAAHWYYFSTGASL